ncbi:MAG: DUF3160 domain-containing protein [Spirochaetales bacterium]|nr:DUF3160 domain-containing protein [Spirochaetales bacterium]
MIKKGTIDRLIIFLAIIISVFYFNPLLSHAQLLTGDVWFSPSEVISLQNSECITELHLNSGEQKFGAYGFRVSYNNDIVSVDTLRGNNGVSAGPDGFVAAVNRNNPGVINITGFDAQGTGPGQDLNILTIYWLTNTTTGMTPLSLVINQIVDETTAPIGESPRAIDGIVTVYEGEIGDANIDGSTDIVDALIIAQYYVGLSPQNFHLELADFNHDGLVDIVDALLVAQYYVDLIIIKPTPTPTPTSTDVQVEPTPLPGNLPGNWSDITNFIQVNDNQTNKCIENGFVVMSNIESNTLSQVYVALSQAQEIPPFITTDALLHVFHITFAHMSEIIEKTELYDLLSDLLQYLNADVMNEYNSISGEYPFVKDAARRLWIYTAIAEALIKGEGSISGTAVSPVATQVNDTLTKIYACEVPEPGALEDYTQYKPRGHYKGDLELENYFRATTWLDRQRFHVEEEIECTESVIMGYVLTRNTVILELWETLYNFFITLNNDAPSNNPVIINELAISIISGYPANKYLSLELKGNRTSFMNALAEISDPDTLYTLFMNTGFSMDMDALDKSVGPENVTGRYIPKSLDVGSTVFDSLAAYEEHQAEMDTYIGEKSLQAMIDNLIINYEQKPESEWTQSVYNYMLYTLRALSDVPAGDLPGFMQNEYWAREKLNTQLAAWTELHNDNIVYAESTPTPTPTTIPTANPTSAATVTPGVTSVPTAAPTSSPTVSDVKVQYLCGESMITANMIRPYLNIINSGTQSIPLDELTVRYYFTKEGASPNVFAVDWAAIGASQISGVFYNGYVEIAFAPTAGNLEPSGETGPIQICIHKEDWSFYNQSDDYSFDGSITTYTDWPSIPLYCNGVLIWGNDPFSTPSPTGAPTSPPTITSPPTPLPTTVPTDTPTPTPEPHGFIEPYPAFYSGLKAMCEKAVQAITDAGFGSIHIDKFTQISLWAEKFETCANIILDNTAPFSLEDALFIKNWGYEVDYFFTDVSFVPESDAKSHVITDIFNYNDSVLHEAVGKLHPIIIFYEEPGDSTLRAAIGYTLSYYEFLESGYNRIDDDEWEIILNSSPPQRPSWTEGFIEN